MANIEVQKVNATTFEVTVAAAATTTHVVTADPVYVEKLTGDADKAAVLVERSFEFLLERESNTSILRRFELPVIGSYFPEYEKEMRRRFAA
jgi:hypothetical protein